MIVAAFAAPGVAQAASGPGNVAQTLQSHCERLASKEDFSGAVLLAKDGRVLFQRAYGLANRNYGVANRVDTKFNLASIGKMFTAVAVLRLVEQGRLKLDDRLVKVVPDYANRAVAEQVTVAQLLTHTSGMGNYWEALAKRPSPSVASVKEALALFVGDPLATAPGKFSYSNDGYVVLGLIVERLTGEDYFAHVRRTIFEPLGMRNTDAYRLDEVTPNIAVGYARDLERPGVWRNNQFAEIFRGSPAGGSYSTLADMHAFAEGLRSNRLLGAEMTREFTKGRHPYGRGQYGYGCSEEVINGHRIFGHSGGHIGIANELMVVEDLGYTLIILTNGEVDGFWNVNAAGKRLLAGESEAGRNFDFSLEMARLVEARGVEAGLEAWRARPAGRATRESVVDVEGQKRLHRARPDAAIAILRFNAACFDASEGALWSLAEAYRIAGRRDQALETYQAYLMRAPDDGDAKARIAALIGN